MVLSVFRWPLIALFIVAGCGSSHDQATVSELCATLSDDFSDEETIATDGTGCWTYEEAASITIPECLDALTISDGLLTIDQKNVGDTSCSGLGDRFQMKKTTTLADATIILAVDSWSNLDSGAVGGANDAIKLSLENDGDDDLVPDSSQNFEVALVYSPGLGTQACFVNIDGAPPTELQTDPCDIATTSSEGLCLKAVKTGTTIVGMVKSGTDCTTDSDYTTIDTMTDFMTTSSWEFGIITEDSDGNGTLEFTLEGITVE